MRLMNPSVSAKGHLILDVVSIGATTAVLVDVNYILLDM